MVTFKLNNFLIKYFYYRQVNCKNIFFPLLIEKPFPRNLNSNKFPNQIIRNRRLKNAFPKQKAIKESDWCKGTSPDSLSHFFSSFLLPTIGAYLSFTQRHAREMNGKIRSALVACKQKTKRQPLNCAVLPKEFSCGSKRCGERCDLTSAWEMRIELTKSQISGGD